MRKTCVVLHKIIITFSHLIADFVAVLNILLYENGKTYDASLLIQKDGTIAGVQKMVHIAQAERHRHRSRQKMELQQKQQEQTSAVRYLMKMERLIFRWHRLLHIEQKVQAKRHRDLMSWAMDRKPMNLDLNLRMRDILTSMC